MHSIIRRLPALLPLFGLAFALGLPAVAEPIVIGQTRTLTSKVLGEQRTLFVYTPAGYAAGQARYPVLYLLDAETRFHHTTGTVAALARTGRIPDMVVIGLTNTNRTRDFVPPWTGAQVTEDWAGAAAQAGGADTFLRFFREELIPWVDREYRTEPYRILVGHSFGGLFASHVLATAPETFNAYVALAPSLSWDGGLPVQRLETLFTERPDLERFYFVNLADEGGEMQQQYVRLVEALRYRAPKGLRHASGLYIDETHGTIPLSGVEAALDSLYERWPAPASAFEGGLPRLLAHYEALSAEFGYPIRPAENLLNNLGYRLLADGKVPDAIAIFERNVRLYPGSANVYDSLGEALEAAGRPQEARGHYEKAVAIGRKTGDPLLPQFEARLAEGSDSR